MVDNVSIDYIVLLFELFRVVLEFSGELDTI